MGSRPETYTGNDDRSHSHLDGEAQRKTLSSPSSPRNEPGQAGNLDFDIGRNNSTSRALAGLESTRQELTQTVIADGKASSRSGGAALSKLFRTHPAIERTDPTLVESATPTPPPVWNAPKRHPLDTLRKKRFGNGHGSSGEGTVTGDTSTADEITKLRVYLRRAQEEAARERERREVCEEQATMAYASLEAESKR